MVRKRNDFKEARQNKAAERSEIRAGRTNEQQIQHILARGGKPDCKEIQRLTNEQGLDKMTLDEWEQAQSR